MPNVLLTDIREYIFPIFLANVVDKKADMSSAEFLGTGFFVTGRGDAITAAHVIPGPDIVTATRRAIAIVLIDGKEMICWINRAGALLQQDVALIRIGLTKTKYFEVSSEEVPPGTDVTVIGIPKHKVGGTGLEVRILKGHVTGVYNRLELNFPIPAGMSGAPVLREATVIGYATGRVRSEEIEEQIEELIKLTGNVEQIQIHTTSSITYYGIAKTFASLQDVRASVLEGQTILEAIEKRKHEP